VKIKVLFVCLGNICRSPLAEAVFNKVIEKENLYNSFSADSCGTASYHIGKFPEQRTLETGRKFGLEFDHVARILTKGDFETFDYILAMDKFNLDDIHDLSNRENIIPKSEIFLMRDFDDQGQGEDVPDPYYGEIEEFHQVYHILKRSVSKFVDHLRERHAIN